MQVSCSIELHTCMTACVTAMPTLCGAGNWVPATAEVGYTAANPPSSCFLPSPSVAFPGLRPCSTPSPSGGVRTLASSRSTRPRSEDTIAQFEATGSPVVTDGEQRKYHNFWTYPVHGLANTAPDGFRIPFAAGHTRRMPRLTAGPFRYQRYADEYVTVARRHATAPVKQAIISPSALSLMYPSEGIPRLLPRRIHRGPAGRARHRDPAIVRGRRRHRADRFHRGPPGGEARSRRRPAAPLHRPEQPGAGPPDRGRTIARSACTRARAATATPPTAPTSTTPTCSQACCSSAPGGSTSRSPASPIASTC